MENIRITKYNSYHIGSSVDFSIKQLKSLTVLFNSPSDQAKKAMEGRRAVTFTRIDNIGSVVVKHYARGGALNHLNKKWYLKSGKSRCQTEFEMFQKAGRIGLNVPEPIAFAYMGTLIYRAWLVTRTIKHSRTLAAICRENEAHAIRVMPSVLDQVLLLIKNKIHHVDFHPGNVLVDEKEQVYLIDFDKAGPFHGNKKRLQKCYSRRWKRAVIKHNLPVELYKIIENIC